MTKQNFRFVRLLIAAVLALTAAACQYRPNKGAPGSEPTADGGTASTFRNTTACPTDPGLTPCGLEPTNAPPKAQGGYRLVALAGSGTRTFADGKGTQASFGNPIGITAGPDGALYVADAGSNRIRKVSRDGTVTTFAGDGTAGWKDGPAASAQFNGPRGVAFGTDGTLYVADTSNQVIRAISPSGTVRTIAGQHGHAGLRNAFGKDALFATPSQLVVSADGRSIFVTEFDNHDVRVMSRDGSVVRTFAGSGTQGLKNGEAATAQFDSPVGIVAAADGVVYVADAGNNVIRRIEKGVVATLAGRKAEGFLDGKGAAAKFNLPYGMTTDAAGNLYVTEYANNSIRRVTTAGVVTTVIVPPARQPSPGERNAAPTLNLPAGIVFAGGSFYIADSGHAVIRTATKG